MAIAIKLDSCTPGIEADLEPYHAMMEQMEAADLPHVVVCQTTSGTPLRECVLGDGMAKSFVAAGGAGFVTDGGVRDLKGILDQGFPVFAATQVAQHADMHWSDLGEPVQVGGVEVRTGDLIHGDYGGCVAIPEANHPWIVGGSTAAVSCALACARGSLSVFLLSRYTYLGEDLFAGQRHLLGGDCGGQPHRQAGDCGQGRRRCHRAVPAGAPLRHAL